MKKRFHHLAIRVATWLAVVMAGVSHAAPPAVGPANGTLFIVGGGDKTAIWPIYFELIGGSGVPIVVITTANEETGASNPDVKELKALGANVIILHTNDRSEADTDKFVAPLKLAHAVWITGGRQWRLVDSYLGTKTETELKALLDRGGVIGGTSAGASIMASYLVRGARSGNDIMMAPGYEQGFAFTQGTAIDQHINTRNREDDIKEVLIVHPDLLGVGLDESTGIIVRGDRADVAGASIVRFTFPSASSFQVDRLAAGQAYDLAARRIIPPPPTPKPPIVRPASRVLRVPLNGIVVVSGTAESAAGILRVEYAFKRGGPYRKLPGALRWRGRVRLTKSTRLLFVRAIDRKSQRSPIVVLRVLR